MKKGDFVEIDFIGRLENGEIFDLTDKKLAKEEGIFNPNATYRPITIILGENFILPKLEEEIMKMKPDQEKRIELNPEEAFGKRNPKLTKIIPKKIFKGKELKPGMLVDFGSQKARIQSINGGRVRLDFNHPLAGKKLCYEIKVNKIIENDEERVDSLLEFFGLKNKYKISNERVVIKSKIPKKLEERIISLIKKYIQNVEKVEFKEGKN